MHPYAPASVPWPCHQRWECFLKQQSLVAVRILTSVYHFYLKESWLLGEMIHYGFVIMFKVNLGHPILKSKDIFVMSNRTMAGEGGIQFESAPNSQL